MSNGSLAQPLESPQKVAFEEIEHTADWALRVRGSDMRELLINAACGMATLMVSDLSRLPTEVEQQFELESIDPESLLVDWLSELAYRAETEMLIFQEFELSEVTPTRLRATARGGFAPDLNKHIKAVTYHNLEIVETKNGLEATVVFDV